MTTTDLYFSLFNILILFPIFIYIHNKYIGQLITLPFLQFLMLLLIYPIRYIIIYLDPTHRVQPYHNIVISDLDLLMFYANLSLLFYFIGFLFALSSYTKPYKIKLKINELVLYSKTHLFMFISYVVISIFFIYISSSINQIGDAEVVKNGNTFLWNMFFSLKGFIFIYFIYYYVTYNKGFPLLLILGLYEFGNALVSGSKQSILLFIISFLLVIFKNGAKIKYTFIFSGVFGLFIAVVISEISRYYLILNSTHLSIIQFIERYLYLFTNKEIIFSAFNVFTKRLHGIDSLYNISLEFPNHIHYFYGETLTRFFISFYPRLFWSDKPDIAMGLWFGKNVFHVENTGVAFWMPGEFYMNFAFFGLLLVPMYSFLLTKIEKKFHYKNMTLFNFFIYLTIFLTIKTQEFTVAASFAGLLKNIVVPILLIRILFFMTKIRYKDNKN